MKSESGSAKRWWCSRAACSWSAGRSRGSWIDSAAASTRTSPTTPWRSASRTIRASRGSAGTRASCRPVLVRRTWSPCVPRVDGAELLEQQDAVLDGPGVGRLDEREGRDVPEAEGRHLEDDRGQVGAEDLGLGELGPPREVLLGVEPDAGAGGDPAAAPGPLVRRCLRDGLDGQALHLGAPVVPGDPGRARVDHADDARDGQGGLGDVGGQHDPAAAVGGEDAVLVGGRQPGVQREELGALQVEAGERLGRVADLPLAREEHEDVARSLADQLLHGVADGLRLVPPVARLVADGPVAGPPPGRTARTPRHGSVAEVPGEASGVDRGRGDDDLEVGTGGEELAEVPEEEVDVEAALVRLVDDEHLVGPQHPVALDLGEEDPVGHDLDEGVLAARGR